MAKNPQQERKQQLIASLQSKRAEMAKRADTLQGNINPRKKVAPKTKPQPLATRKTAPNFLSKANKLKSLPKIGKFLGKRNRLTAKLPTNLIRKETAKPILIGLGGAFIVVSLIGARKKHLQKKKEAAALKEASKPAIGFLLFKTLLSVSEPALKHLVVKGMKKRLKD